MTESDNNSSGAAYPFLWAMLVLMLLLFRSLGAIAMSSTADGSRELSFYDAPYWVTFTIPKSRDSYQLIDGLPSQIQGGRIIAGFTYTPPTGGAPNQSVSIHIYDRGGGDVEKIDRPFNLTLQEFIVEYGALMADFVRRTVEPNVESISTETLGGRTWFKVRRSGTSTHRIQYWTPVDEEKMVVLDWSPPRNRLFSNREAKKLPEIQSIVASIRVSKAP